jgi:hypothetical protein
MALSALELVFVRSANGHSTPNTVAPEDLEHLQAVARTVPHAMLGRKLLVCEGATEVGLCRGLEDFWSATNEPLSAS